MLRALGVTRRGIAALLALEGAALGAAGRGDRHRARASPAAAVAARAFGADLGAGLLRAARRGPSRPIRWRSPASRCSASPCRVAGARGSRARLNRDATSPTRCATARSTCPRDARAAGVPRAACSPPPACRCCSLPPVAGLPLGGYAAIALWLAAAVAAVGPACRAGARPRCRRARIRGIARARAGAPPARPPRRQRGRHRGERLAVRGDGDHGVLVSRLARRTGSRGVVGADLYVRASPAGDSAFFTRRTSSADRRACQAWRRGRGAALRPPRTRGAGARRSRWSRARSTRASSPASRPSRAACRRASAARSPVWITEAAARPARLEDRRAHRAADRGPAGAGRVSPAWSATTRAPGARC